MAVHVFFTVASYIAHIPVFKLIIYNMLQCRSTVAVRTPSVSLCGLGAPVCSSPSIRRANVAR